MHEVMQMKKLDLATLQKAYRGEITRITRMYGWEGIADVRYENA